MNNGIIQPLFHEHPHHSTTPWWTISSFNQSLMNNLILQSLLDEQSHLQLAHEQSHPSTTPWWTISTSNDSMVNSSLFNHSLMNSLILQPLLDEQSHSPAVPWWTVSSSSDSLMNNRIIQPLLDEQSHPPFTPWWTMCSCFRSARFFSVGKHFISIILHHCCYCYCCCHWCCHPGKALLSYTDHDRANYASEQTDSWTQADRVS